MRLYLSLVDDSLYEVFIGNYNESFSEYVENADEMLNIVVTVISQKLGIALF